MELGGLGGCSGVKYTAMTDWCCLNANKRNAICTMCSAATHAGTFSGTFQSTQVAPAPPTHQICIPALQRRISAYVDRPIM